MLLVAIMVLFGFAFLNLLFQRDMLKYLWMNNIILGICFIMNNRR